MCGSGNVGLHRSRNHRKKGSLRYPSGEQKREDSSGWDVTPRSRLQEKHLLGTVPYSTNLVVNPNIPSRTQKESRVEDEILLSPRRLSS
mmetsp:Transcript_33733/g.77837  ORF Transcript_33733/g.77837 Transcript_33733/m.77837 type:complete len:89 (+) Transcript_33733:467-733(+)